MSWLQCLATNKQLKLLFDIIYSDVIPIGSGSGSITETALHLNAIQPSTTCELPCAQYTHNIATCPLCMLCQRIYISRELSDFQQMPKSRRQLWPSLTLMMLPSQTASFISRKLSYQAQWSFTVIRTLNSELTSSIVCPCMVYTVIRTYGYASMIATILHILYGVYYG